MIQTQPLESALATSTTFAIASTGILIKYVFLVLGVTLAVALGIGLLYWGIRKAVSAVHGRTYDGGRYDKYWTNGQIWRGEDL